MGNQLKRYVNRINRFISRERAPLLVLAGAVVLFLVLVIPFNGLLESYNERTAARAVEHIRAGLAEEQRHLLTQARALDEARIFDAYIASRDIVNLSSLVIEETRARDLGGLLIADEQGVALSRARAVAQRGDFIFHTTTWGRALAQKEEVASVEHGAAHPLNIMGAVPMIRDGQLRGAIVAVHFPTDTYLEQFRKRYLSRGVELAFITPQAGLVGTSFQEKRKQEHISASFTAGTDFVRTADAMRPISFNGDHYLVRNVQLEGLEGSPGSVLVFVPVQAELQSAVLAAGTTTVFLAVLFFVFHHLSHRHASWIHPTVMAAGAIVVFVFAYLVNVSLVSEQFLDLDPNPYVIYNSTMHMDPETATLGMTYEHRVALVVRTGGEAINAVQAVLSFDPEKVRIADIVTTDSLCDSNFFIERMINNEQGEVRIACGTPDGFEEREGIVAELLVQPIQMGTFELQFTGGTQVLAHDGLGTDVLRQAIGGSYSAVDLTPREEAERVGPLVFSPSHPNKTRWYNTLQAQFTWQSDQRGAVRYALDQQPDTVPQGEASRRTTLTTSVAGDGVHYFHLLREGNSEPVHYKLKVDTTPPSKPSVRASADVVERGEVVRFAFESSDALSGLQDTFYVRLDGGIFLPIGRSFFTAFMNKGEREITVRAFDEAGNYSETTKTIRVR